MSVTINKTQESKTEDDSSSIQQEPKEHLESSECGSVKMFQSNFSELVPQVMPQPAPAPDTSSESSQDDDVDVDVNVNMKTNADVDSKPKNKKLFGYDFYRKIGSPKFVCAPMVRQSEV